MIKRSELEHLLQEYANVNLELRKKKNEVLKLFSDIEAEFRGIELSLSNLEQRFHVLGMEKYEKIVQGIIEELVSGFSPYDVKRTVDRVREYTEYIDYRKKDFELTNANIGKANSIFLSFKSGKSKFGKSNEIIFSQLESSLNKMFDLVREADWDSLGTLRHKISEIIEDIQGIVSLIEKAREYSEYYIFCGDEALGLRRKLEDLFDGRVEHDSFISVLRETIEQIEHVIEGSVYRSVPVPVVELYKESDKSIKNYALLFGNYVLDFNVFLEEGEEPLYRETGEYIYLQHFPYKGIFRVEEFLNPYEPVFDLTFPPNMESKMNFDENYVRAVETLHKRAYNNFYILSGFGFAGVLLGLTLPLSGILMDVAVVASLFAGYAKYVKNALKPLIEDQFNRENIFVFSKIDFGYWSFGEDLDMSAIGPSILEHFDETVMNDEYRMWLEKVLEKNEVKEKQ